MEKADALSTMQGPPPISNFGVLEQRVSEHDRSIQEIKASLSAIDIKIDSIHKDVLTGRIPNILVICTVATMVFGGAAWEFNNSLDPLKLSISEIKATLKDMAPEKEIMEAKAELVGINAELKRIDIMKLDRADMTTRLAALDERIDEFNRRLKRQ